MITLEVSTTQRYERASMFRHVHILSPSVYWAHNPAQAGTHLQADPQS
jgi:hypothetical protein